jgi:hypothetical protein
MNSWPWLPLQNPIFAEELYFVSNLRWVFRSFSLEDSNCPRLGNPPQKHRCIVKISKVNITSTLSTNFANFEEYRHPGPIRRRNALRPKLLKTLQKPKIIIETNDNSKVDAGNFKPIVGDNSKG